MVAVAAVGGAAVAAYGKKAKDASCRPRTAKEEWKEREATLSQALPTRIKIFEGGSVRLMTIVMFVIGRCGSEA